MPKSPVRILPVVALLVTLAACSGGASPPAVSPPAASASATPSPSSATVDTAAAAAARAATLNPALVAVGPKDPDAIGQAYWWEAQQAGGAWRVTFHVGWGDCPAGCINEHTWTYDVGRDGAVTPIGEQGQPVPKAVVDDLLAQGSSIRTGVGGRITAGPTCPVVRVNDPKCDERPVPGAVVVIRDRNGAEVARGQTNADGRYEIELRPGDYVVEPQPANGLLGTPNAVALHVDDGRETHLDLSYDTGIR